MAIYKAKGQNSFAIIPNSTAQDSSISFEARGLLTLMLSMPEDWEIRKEWLIKQSPNCGRDKMTRILKELIEAGYVIKKPARKGKRLNGVDWIVYAEPQPVQLKTRPTDDQSSDESNTTNKHLYKETESQRNNIDVITNDECYFSIEQISEQYPKCAQAMKVIKFLKRNGYEIYDGGMRLGVWADCEEVMSSVYFDTAYITWWMEEKAKHMRKMPSLDNMLASGDMTTFAEMYEVYIKNN